jgi:hypothetical protein
VKNLLLIFLGFILSVNVFAEDKDLTAQLRLGDSVRREMEISAEIKDLLTEKIKNFIEPKYFNIELAVDVYPASASYRVVKSPMNLGKLGQVAALQQIVRLPTSADGLRKADVSLYFHENVSGETVIAMKNLAAESLRYYAPQGVIDVKTYSFARPHLGFLEFLEEQKFALLLLLAAATVLSLVYVLQKVSSGFLRVLESPSYWAKMYPWAEETVPTVRNVNGTYQLASSRTAKTAAPRATERLDKFCAKHFGKSVTAENATFDRLITAGKFGLVRILANRYFPAEAVLILPPELLQQHFSAYTLADQVKMLACFPVHEHAELTALFCHPQSPLYWTLKLELETAKRAPVTGSLWEQPLWARFLCDVRDNLSANPALQSRLRIVIDSWIQDKKYQLFSGGKKSA